MKASDGKSERARGASLVEVALAILLLAVLALAGGSYIHHARGQLGVQRHKRIAAEIANSRLEDIRASLYDRVKPSNLNYAVYYLAKSGTNWIRSGSNPNETTNLHGRVYPITTTVFYEDQDGGLPSYDYIRIRADVRYRPGTGSVVIMESKYAPW